jgi:phosphonate transport system substrate-binding protein
MRANLPEACKTGLRETLSANIDRLWEALISTERNEGKFLNRDSYMAFDIQPDDYQVVREAYASAGIDLK